MQLFMLFLFWCGKKAKQNYIILYYSQQSFIFNHFLTLIMGLICASNFQSHRFSLAVTLESNSAQVLSVYYEPCISLRDFS